MNDLSPSTLLVLVPLLPLVGAILTVALGRVLGPRAHLPAIAGIAAAFVVAVMLLTGMAREVGVGTTGHDHAAKPVEMVTTLWEWAAVGDAAATGDVDSDDLPREGT
jgi:NADH:ubiquinone oxidoreductase subunit 5 (subunit L)/multisubunit Na+/H+ antiporter MnhA subunit